MDPTVVAAWIAAGVSVLTLVGTLVAQYLGYRATSRDAEKTAEEQRKQLDRTFAEQNQQLDRTLTEQRTRTLNERFATAAEQLGSDKPAVRLAGVHAMAGLADDWPENRQTCVDVLCAYLRMPYEADPDLQPGQVDGPGLEPKRLAFQASREVRHSVIRVITVHLREDAAASWQGLNFDFTGVVFDGGDFRRAWFSGGIVHFSGARFSRGVVWFSGARFSGGTVDFSDAQFSGGTVDFSSARFLGGAVVFSKVSDWSIPPAFPGRIRRRQAWSLTNLPEPKDSAGYRGSGDHRSLLELGGDVGDRRLGVRLGPAGELVTGRRRAG